MLKPKLAYAIVYKKRPVINLNEIYSKEQIKDCFVEKDEMVVEVVINERAKDFKKLTQKQVFKAQLALNNMQSQGKESIDRVINNFVIPYAKNKLKK